jgi:hypothetical protein
VLEDIQRLPAELQILKDERTKRSEAEVAACLEQQHYKHHKLLVHRRPAVVL